MKKLYILTFFAVALTPLLTFAQATIPVTHFTGSMVVGGVNITVLQDGCSDILTSYCPNVTSPYLVGYNSISTTICNGSYTFQFSPPVDSLTLNFSGVTNVQNHQEILILDVNGNHFPLTNPGTANDCDDSLAIIDASGNIAGCYGCAESGWTGTTITGPISELTISDSILLGQPGGALFSLFINDLTTAAVAKNSLINLQVFPNPFSAEIKIESETEGTITIHDISGRVIHTKKAKIGSTVISSEDFANGVYALRFISNDGSIELKRILKQ